MNDITKQPKWVQDKVRKMERKIETQKAHIEVLEAAYSGPSVINVGWPTDLKFRGLPGAEKIRIDFGGKHQMVITPDLESGTINIMDGLHQLKIKPKSSNSITIGKDENYG